MLSNYLLIFKILPVTSFKNPKAAVLTLKKLTGRQYQGGRPLPYLHFS
jgi:hypothetical protein